MNQTGDLDLTSSSFSVDVCVCLYNVIFVSSPSIIDAEIEASILSKWTKRFENISKIVAPLLDESERSILELIGVDFFHTLLTPSGEMAYRREGFAGIRGLGDSRHDCLTSIHFIKRIYDILKTINDIVSPRVTTTKKFNMNRGWKQFLQLKGVEDSVRGLLQHGGWLNETIIDYYFDLLTIQRPTVCVLPSYCQQNRSSSQIFKREFENEHREMIICSMNLKNTHWFLSVYHLGANEISTYDSFYTGLTDGHRENIEIFRDLLRLTLNIRPKEKILFYNSSQGQMKTYDCGVFTIANAEQLSRNVDPDYDQSYIREFRLQILKQIKEGTISPLDMRKRSEENLLDDYKRTIDNFMRDFLSVTLEVQGRSNRTIVPDQNLQEQQLQPRPRDQVQPRARPLKREMEQEQHQLQQTQDQEDDDDESNDDDEESDELVDLLKLYKLKSVFTGQVLGPLIGNEESVQGGTHSNVEPKNPDLSVNLFEIRKINLTGRINFYCKFEKNRRIQEDWLDLIVVSKLRPFNIYKDFMTRLYLFGRGTYKYIENKAQKLDSDKRRKFKEKCYPLVDPILTIAKEHIEAKDRARLELRRENKRRNSFKRRLLSTMDLRRRQLEGDV